MRPCFDLSNKVFGNWKVIEQVDVPMHITSDRKKSYWHCICKCGYESIVLGTKLRCGRSKSCGCGLLKKEKK